MHFTYAFSRWTLHTLTRSAASLTSLSIHYEIGAREDMAGNVGMWTKALSEIDLPCLTNFTFAPRSAITADLGLARHMTNPIPFLDLLRFLNEHPTIKTLKLSYFEVPSYAPGHSLPTPLFADESGARAPDFLPALEILEADPQIVPWIITEQRGRSTSLRAITITVIPNVDELMGACNAVIARMSYTNVWDFLDATQLHQYVSITVDIWDSRLLHLWLLSQVDLHVSGATGLRHLSLRLMGGLVTKLWDRALCTCYTTSLRQALGRWMGCFPDLEQLTIIAAPCFEEPRADLSLVIDTFRDFCPRLRTVDLPRLGLFIDMYTSNIFSYHAVAPGQVYQCRRGLEASC